MKKNSIEKNNEIVSRKHVNTAVMALIRSSIWGDNPPVVDRDIYNELKKHAIIALPAQIISTIIKDEALLKEWKTAILGLVAYNAKCKHQQANLPLSVPYAVLKGTSAAQYYPYPQYRAQGDIDIITRKDDFDIACDMLLQGGYIEKKETDNEERGRHRQFIKNGIVVEVHLFFASMNDLDNAKAFDELIIQNITTTHVLPDLINGLVLIEHINQHLEDGIGLRQIIDWMMFVDKCLSDEQWPQFQKMVDRVGLEKLSIVTTRMCELYLGLPNRNWCRTAEEKLCSDLMEYIMACGNFGQNMQSSMKKTISGIERIKHPIKLIRGLQHLGRQNWKMAENLLFRPVAWIWQCLQYSKEASLLSNHISEARNLNALFSALGIKRKAQGLVYYKDGQYLKK